MENNSTAEEKLINALSAYKAKHNKLLNEFLVCINKINACKGKIAALRAAHESTTAAYEELHKHNGKLIDVYGELKDLLEQGMAVEAFNTYMYDDLKADALKPFAKRK